MKGLVIVLALMAPLFGFLACYPRGHAPCAPNDTSCFGCDDPRTTNPACAPFPNDDTKRPTDGGSP